MPCTGRRQAARAAEEAVDKDALAQAYEMLNAIYAGSGREEPMPYGRLALLADTELGNLQRQAHCLNNLAVQSFTRGEWNEALASYRQATEIFRRIGDTASEVNATYNQAELLVRQGRLEEAEALLPDVLLVARGMEDEELVALALREQAQAVAGAGDVAEAVQLLGQARQLFEELQEAPEAATTAVVLAEVLFGAGRTEEARGVLDRMLADLGPDSLNGLEVRVHRLTGRLHAKAGSLAEARSEAHRRDSSWPSVRPTATSRRCCCVSWSPWRGRAAPRAAMKRSGPPRSSTRWAWSPPGDLGQPPGVRLTAR